MRRVAPKGRSADPRNGLTRRKPWLCGSRPGPSEGSVASQPISTPDAWPENAEFGRYFEGRLTLLQVSSGIRD